MGVAIGVWVILRVFNTITSRHARFALTGIAVALNGLNPTLPMTERVSYGRQKSVAESSNAVFSGKPIIYFVFGAIIY